MLDKELLTEENKFILKRFNNMNNIEQIINIDEHVNFWGKSQEYINELNNNLKEHEFKKLQVFMNNIGVLIYNNYFKCKRTLLISSRHHDIGLAIWYFYFNKYANMPYDVIQSSLVLNLPHIPIINEYLKRFLSFCKKIDN